MPLPDRETVQRAIGLDLGSTSFTYDARDVALYALGIGAPADPLDQGQLRFVFQGSRRGFQVFPTFAVCFSHALTQRLLSGNLAGIIYEPMMLLHGEQRLQLLNDLPPAATVHSRLRIADIFDKGSGMLVIIDVESCLENGTPLSSATTSVFLRGYGGYGGARGDSPKSQLPARQPDRTVEERTLPQQALLYRLSGDANPLHVDPDSAAVGQYERPILHGLCTFGFAARALVGQFGAQDATRLRSISARFAGHVFPGETLVTQMWQLAPGEVAFQTKVKEREQVVLSHARARLQPL